MNISKEFTDHSWDEMKKILDREMPEKRNKRFFWFYFLVFLVVGVATIAWFKSNNKELPSLSQDIHAIQQIDDQNNGSTISRTDQLKNNNNRTQELSLTNVKQDLSNQLVPESVKSTRHPKNTLLIKNIESDVAEKIQTSNITYSEPIKSSKGKESIKSLNESNSSLSPLNSLNLLSAKAKENKIDRQIIKNQLNTSTKANENLHIANLKLMTPNLFYDERRENIDLDVEYFSDKIIPVDPIVRKRDRFNFGVFASLHSGNLKSYGGWEAGIHLSYFPTKRFGLQFNTSYSCYEKYGFNETVGVKSFEPAFEDVWNELNSDSLSFASADELIYTVDQLKYLNFELESKIYLTRNLSLISGIYASKLLSVYNKAYSRSDMTSISTYPNFSLQGNRSLQETYDLQNYDFGFNVGISYDYKRITGYFKFNSGLLPLLNDSPNDKENDSYYIGGGQSAQRDVNRSFELGLAFRLF